MKRFDFPLDAYQANRLFMAIRSKRDVIEVLMLAMKIMLLPVQVIPGVAGTLSLRVDKMSRLFVSIDKKVFSINFPFSVIEIGDGMLKFKSAYHQEIGVRVVSEVLSILNDVTSSENRDVIAFARTPKNCEF